MRARLEALRARFFGTGGSRNGKPGGPAKKPVVFSHSGFCEICDAPSTFAAEHEYFRESLKCPGCRSIPRERALMRVLRQCLPNYDKQKIHESSPTFRRGFSSRLKRECPNYTYSHFYPDVPLGEMHPEQDVRCENLEHLTFDDESFDLFLSQDVMEHVFNPEPAFKQIARTLKPGGLHVFTAPLVNKFKPTQVRSSQLPSGEVVHHLEPKYHGNPIDQKSRSLMTMSWGYDIVGSIIEWTGMPTTIVQIDDIDHGIRADLIEVVVSRKPKAG